MTKITVTHLVALIAEQLVPRYSDENVCVQHAWWMLHAITLKTRAQLIAEQSITLTDDQKKTLSLWITKQVVEQYPLDYLIGFVSFADLAIQVKPPILIPRPETEEWVMRLIEDLQPQNLPLTILDMCTGSGCIGIALAHALPQATVYAVDIEQQALDLARQNVTQNTIKNMVLLKSDLFTALPSDLRFDIIVANPPYISQAEWHMVEPSVAQWEDTRALLAADDGLAILNTIITQAPGWLKENSDLKARNTPQLIVEIGAYQADKVSQLMKETGYSLVTIQKDLAGHDRTVSGRINHVATDANT